MGKCIYCNTENDLSASDIIPDALTNLRIINRNVCSIKHNNKFSDMFESKVIEDFSYITNTLGIKSSKAKEYHGYDAHVYIDGEPYNIKKMSSDAKMFKGRVLKSCEGGHLLTTLEKVQQMAKKNADIVPIDINKSTIEKYVYIPTEIFFTHEIYRLMAKISFEWYCQKNNIEEMHDDFTDIIKFITTGNGVNPVSVITRKDIYDKLSAFSSMPGSHILLGFIDSRGRVNIMISFFGIFAYRVIVAKEQPYYCKNNVLFSEIRVDGKKKEFIRGSYDDVKNEYRHAVDSLVEEIHSPCTEIIKQQDGICLCVAQQNDNAIKMRFIETFNEIVEQLCKQDGDDEINFCSAVDIIRNNLEKNLAIRFLHTNTLKRFVKDHSIFDGSIKINFDNSSPTETFLLYVVMRIGEENPKKLDEVLYQRMTAELLLDKDSHELLLTSEMGKKLKSLMKSKKNIIQLLKQGANIIITST